MRALYLPLLGLKVNFVGLGARGRALRVLPAAIMCRSFLEAEK